MMDVVSVFFSFGLGTDVSLRLFIASFSSYGSYVVFYG